MAVLLPQGLSLNYLDRLCLIDELQDIAKCRVDLVAVNQVNIPLKFEIVHSGKVLFEADFDARTDAEDIILRDYFDLEPMYRQNYQEIMEDVLGKKRMGDLAWACSWMPLSGTKLTSWPNR